MKSDMCFVYSSLAQRSGVGYRFFESQSYSSMLKKMKQRLQATAEHHRNRSVETGADHDAVTDGDREISKQFEQTRALHEKLTGYGVEEIVFSIKLSL